MIYNIAEDIYARMLSSKEIDREHLSTFLKGIEQAIKNSLEIKRGFRNPHLRMSSIGKPDRKIWLEINHPKEQREMEGSFLIRMLYGSIVEELILLLVKEAGYSVTDEQKEVMVNGITGHIDCKVNGFVVDVKSASDFGFRKFKKGFDNDDDFGYIGQLSGYVDAEGGDVGYFLVMNKSSGEVTLLEVDSMEMINSYDRIGHLRSILADKKALPSPCEVPTLEKASGNKVLPRICKFCEYKEDCWPNIRAFQYSRGVKYFTEVVKEPRVEEINV